MRLAARRPLRRARGANVLCRGLWLVRNWARASTQIIDEGVRPILPTEPQILLQVLLAKTPVELVAASRSEGTSRCGCAVRPGGNRRHPPPNRLRQSSD